MRAAVRGPACPACVVSLVLTLAGAAAPVAAQLNTETKVVLHAIPGSSANRCWTPAQQGYDDCALETNTHVAPGARVDVYVLLIDYDQVSQVRFGVEWDASWTYLAWRGNCHPGQITLPPNESGGDFETAFPCQTGDTLVTLGWFSFMAGDPGTELRLVDHSAPGGAAVLSCVNGNFAGIGPFRRGAVGADPSPGMNPCSVQWVVLDYPNGGEALVALDPVTLRWQADHIDRLRVELSTDGGATFEVWPGAESVPNTGAFATRVPASPGSGRIVRLADAADGAPSDLSDGPFAIEPALQVLVPNGGETYHSGGTAVLSWWATSFVQATRLELSTDAGATFVPIASLPAGIRQYTWQEIPFLPSDRCQVRIQDIASGHGDTSDSLFAIAEGIEVIAVEPETLTIGAEATVFWFASPTIPAVRIEYSTDGGATFATLAEDVPSGPDPGHRGRHRFRVEPPETFAGVIRVADSADGSPSDLSRTFAALEGLILAAPNGGEMLWAGEEVEIRWAGSPAIAAVRIELSTDGGQSFGAIVASTPNTGSFAWQVPPLSSSDCLIRVADAADGIPADVSNAAFTVRSIVVVRPDGGELFCSGREQKIGWIAGPLFAAVRIEYSTDGGQSFQTVVESTPNDSSFAWMVPAVPEPALAILRISSLGDPAIGDASDGPFTMRTCQVIRVPADALTIQSAIELAELGDEVIVGPGIYPERDILLKGGVPLRSESGAAVTAIDAGGQGSALIHAPGASRVDVEGFTITGSVTQDQGALALSSPAEISRCVIKDSRPWGARCESGAVTFRSSRFSGNGTATMPSGALYSGYWAVPVLEDCEVIDNEGMGILASNGCDLARCLISRNATAFSAYTGDIRECTVTDNRSGILLSAYGSVTDCVIARNFFSGVDCHGASAYIDGCLIHGNGVGVYLGIGYYHTSYALIEESTIAYNGTGIAAYCNYEIGCSRARLERSILAFPTAGRLILGTCDLSMASQAQCSAIFAPGAEVGCYLDLGLNLVTDPRFCDPANGDFHLAPGSPLLDAPGCGRIGALGAGCPLGPTAVEALPGPVPPRAFVAGPQPNPSNLANPDTRLTLGLPARGNASVRIYDVAGRLVRVLVTGILEAGVHEVRWDGKDERGAPVASGVYVWRVEAPGLDATRKLVVIR